MSDRPRINSFGHARLYPERVVVNRDDPMGRPWGGPRPWCVWRGFTFISDHPTHAEAITAAQKLARERAGEPPC